MSQDRPFTEECISLGVVGGLCGAAKGAAELLVALAEVRVLSHYLAHPAATSLDASVLICLVRFI